MLICAATGKPCEHSGCIGTGCVKQTGAASVDWSKIQNGTIGQHPMTPTEQELDGLVKRLEKRLEKERDRVWNEAAVVARDYVRDFGEKTSPHGIHDAILKKGTHS